MIFRPFTRRARCPDDGRHTPRDARLFRTLIKHGRHIARAPLADPADFLRAADRAGRAVPPPGHARRDSKFLQLIVHGRMWWRHSPEERQVRAGELALACDACAAALDAASKAQANDPLRPPRRDIFG